jgi:hypothetical protein
MPTPNGPLGWGSFIGAWTRANGSIFQPLLSALSLRLVAVPDLAALDRNRAHYVRRDQPHTISAKKGWNKRKIRGKVTATFCEQPWQATWSK